MRSRFMRAWKMAHDKGFVFACGTIDGTYLRAHSGSFHDEDEPYFVTFDLISGPQYRTRTIDVTVQGPARDRSLHLERSEQGLWTALLQTEGGRQADPELPDLHDAVDCDLWLSPLTNIMPVRRSGLAKPSPAVEESISHVMAWIDLPSLAVHRSRQDYQRLPSNSDGPAMIKLSDRDSEFKAEIEVDTQGFVIDYPNIATRVGELERIEEMITEIPSGLRAPVRAKYDSLVSDMAGDNFGRL